jgi:leader peptidase (prepilin peptidase)/N-methyltransferase
LDVLGQAIFTGNYHRLIPAFYGMLGLLCFYLALMFISRGGMGMGDVKLSSAIGGITGFLGLKYVFIASFSAFFMGAIIGISLMALGKAGRKTAIPFGPFMLVGVFMALLASTI